MPAATDLQSALRHWGEAFMITAWRETGHFIRLRGLSHAQFSLMMTLHYRGEARITALADILGVSAAYASQMIDKMVVNGFLSRTEDPQDRRVNRVTLSPEGLALTEAAIEVRSGWLAKLAEAVPADDQVAATRLLLQLSEAIRPLGSHRSTQSGCHEETERA